VWVHRKIAVGRGNKISFSRDPANFRSKLFLAGGAPHVLDNGVGENPIERSVGKGERASIRHGNGDVRKFLARYGPAIQVYDLDRTKIFIEWLEFTDDSYASAHIEQRFVRAWTKLMEKALDLLFAKGLVHGIEPVAKIFVETHFSPTDANAECLAIAWL
jgi:hypothetical protein